jgi:hypothetical protein
MVELFSVAPGYTGKARGSSLGSVTPPACALAEAADEGADGAADGVAEADAEGGALDAVGAGALAEADAEAAGFAVSSCPLHAATRATRTSDVIAERRSEVSMGCPNRRSARATKARRSLT